jgi:hypothetical protein
MYYIIFSAQTTRWMLCRRQEDPRDDDLVITGVSRRKAPSVDQVVEEIIEELEALQEGLR